MILNFRFDGFLVRQIGVIENRITEISKIKFYEILLMIWTRTIYEKITKTIYNKKVILFLLSQKKTEISRFF